MRTIIVDTRQKPEKTSYISEQLESLGYRTARSKLFVGDYQFADAGNMVVDTKQDMTEIEGNLIQSHERFRNECIRAQEAGISLVILVQDPYIKSVADVFSWYNPRKRFSPKAVSGRQLGKMMISMEQKYGVKFEFCTKTEVGQRIIELLGGE